MITCVRGTGSVYHRRAYTASRRFTRRFISKSYFIPTAHNVTSPFQKQSDSETLLTICCKKRADIHYESIIYGIKNTDNRRLMVSRYGNGLRLEGRIMFLFSGVHVAGKEACQDRSRYLMDKGADGGRNSDGRGKEYRY